MLRWVVWEETTCLQTSLNEAVYIVSVAPEMREWVHGMVFLCWRMHLYLTRMYFWTEGDAVYTLHPSQYLSRRNLCRIPSQSIRDYIH